MAPMPADKDPQPGKRSAVRHFLPALLIVAGLALGYVLGLHQYLTLAYLAESREALKAYVDAHSLLAPTLFALFYAAAVAVSFPAASVLTIFGGFLFGWILGGILVVVAATAGATALFLAARSAFRDTVRQRLGGVAAKLARGFEEGAFGYLLVLRLAPVFPFWVVNLAPALFDIRVRTYVAATALGIMPGTFAYAYLGRGLESVLIAAAASGKDLEVADLVTPQITLAFAALALVALIPLIVRKLRAMKDM
nr:TVP38/TMEM64 family protein [Nitratireductor luteus]